jgi:hypothetical protein
MFVSNGPVGPSLVCKDTMNMLVNACSLSKSLSKDGLRRSYVHVTTRVSKPGSGLRTKSQVVSL